MAASVFSMAALIIGNSAYKSIAVLENPRRDAQKMAAALRAVGFDDVTMAVDVSRDKMIEALRTFAAAADRADWAVVYYAGHGIEVNGVDMIWWNAAGRITESAVWVPIAKGAM